jgi:hypothetical protein
MSAFLVISVGLITFLAISALVFRLASIMVEDTPDWSIKDDPTWMPHRDRVIEFPSRSAPRRSKNFGETQGVSGRGKLRIATPRA